MDFYQTVAGKRFFESQLPRLITALADIASSLKSPAPALRLEQEVPPNFLANLYNGEVDPAAFSDSGALRTHNRKIAAHQEQMRESLAPDAWELVEQYRTLLDTREAAEQEQAFAAGFRYAATLLAAGLSAPQNAVQANKA